jgi:hypothetical protein
MSQASDAFEKSAFAALFLATAAPSPSAAYDMDCKVILCLAGGFPEGCADAYAYMIGRITRRPNPLPTFGFCAMSDGGAYENHDVMLRRPSRTEAAGYHCPAGKTLSLSRSGDRGEREVEAFCYTHVTTRTRRVQGETVTETVHHGRSAPTPVTYEIQITLEPGGEAEFASPVYARTRRRGSWRCGDTIQPRAMRSRRSRSRSACSSSVFGSSIA